MMPLVIYDREGAESRTNREPEDLPIKYLGD